MRTVTKHPRQLDLFAEPTSAPPVHAPPRPAPDRDEEPPFDDIEAAWQDLTGEPYPGRDRVLQLFERARRAGRPVEP